MNRYNYILRKIGADYGQLKFVLFFVFAFCVLAISLIFFALSIGKPYMGITFSISNQGWVVQALDVNGYASQAGIKLGDRPVEINDQPAQLFLEKYNKVGVAFGRLIEEMVVIDEQGQLKSVALKDKSPSWQSVTTQLMWFFVCLAFWVTGFYVFFKRPKNTAAFLLCLSGLIFGLSLSGNTAAGIALPLAPYFEVTASLIGPWLLLHFFLVLPEERAWLRNRPLLYLIYLPAAITVVLFPIIGYSDDQPVLWFRTIRLFEYGAGFLAAAIVALYNYFQAGSPKTRQQMKIVLIGCLTALIPFIVLSVLPEAIWGRTVMPFGFSILLIAFIPLGMGYAVVTRRLMDIDVIVRRSVVYGSITLVMAATLSAAFIIIVSLGRELEVPEKILIALLLAGTATVLFGPVKARIELLVDRLFYKDRYDYRQIIQSLSASLNSLKDFTDIARLIVGTTFQTLNLAGACLFVRGQSGSIEVSAAQGTFTDTNRQKQLVTLISQRSPRIEFPNPASEADPGVSFLIPLVAGDKEVGILCLSQKASRQDFSSGDIFLLQGLATVASISLRSAMLLRDVSLRDTFVSVASHELRTPLTSIVGYADLLLHRDPPEATRKQWLQNIFDNAQRITAMVDDLLNVTRIRSGKFSLKLEGVRLSDILEERLSMMRESTSKHEFVVNIASDLPNVLVDRDKFAQVVGNLLSNAIKYSPSGGRITLSARKDPDRHRVVISVADEGIGISPKDRDLLFTTFHRVQRAETKGVRGSGLGLYIAKEWTEAMGGEIWLESELNKGSTFFVAVPARGVSATVCKTSPRLPDKRKRENIHIRK